jgi:hypothetical protein
MNYISRSLVLLTLLCLAVSVAAGISENSWAQVPTNPAITAWLQNTTVRGRHYVAGNATPVQDNDLANVQSVRYAAEFVYVATQGIPTYITGPFLDRNQSLATAQNAIFKIPLNPRVNTGTKTATTGGNIGIFINGVALFDFRDGVAWNPATNALCGGPLSAQCPGGMMATNDWNRDAVLAERSGFDCVKGHPAMGNYHHHQNPSAFNRDKIVVSNVCTLYPSDGLYAIDSTKHSPLLGFAYDGFPIYGAYAHRNTNGTGGIVRMKSSYSLRSIATRTTSPTGAAVSAGPPVSATYPLGYFREDYQFNQPAAPTQDYLDVHNGRFCVTPEYPQGTYCYFATVDENWNSAYPYVVGPTFYGVRNTSSVTTITEPTTTYTRTVGVFAKEFEKELEGMNISVYPNPSAEVLTVQIGGVVKEPLLVELVDASGRIVQNTSIHAGQSLAFIDLQTVYSGAYFVQISVQAPMQAPARASALSSSGNARSGRIVRKIAVTKE